LIAALLRAIEAEMLTKRVEQSGAGIEREGVLFAINTQFHQRGGDLG
jgi:hypothetical protein